MKNTQSSVIIKDLAPLASEGIQDLSPLEIKKISGGMTFQFSYNVGGSEPYTYINNGGEITEKGTRPEGFDPDGEIITLPPVFTPPVLFSPISLSPMFFTSFFGFLPRADDDTTEETP